jgi:hypothetical protein
MSYKTQAKLADDLEIRARITACVATEGEKEPQRWVTENKWLLSAQPGWDAAYAYAITAGNNHPGDDEGVITDGMILSAVQAIRPPAEVPAAQ